MGKSVQSQAMDEFRVLWLSFALSREEEHKVIFAQRMNELQGYITPEVDGKEWERFMGTMPGFTEYWHRYSYVYEDQESVGG